MGNRKRTSEMTDEEFMREFNLYKKEQIKNGSKRTEAQMTRDFVAEWDRKAKAEAATLPQNRRTKAEWDKINAERMSKGKRPTIVYPKQKEETNQQTEIPEEYKDRFEGKKTRMSIPPISKEGFLNQFSKAQAERDKDEKSKPSEQQLTKHKNDYSDVNPTWPRVNITDEKGNKVEVPDYTKEVAQYVNAIFDNEDDRAKLRKAGVEAVDEILSKSTSGAGSDRTNAPVSVNIKPEEEDPETISIQQSNISTPPSSTPVSSDTVKSVIPETKTTASTPQQTTQPFQTTTKKDRTEGGAEYIDNTDKTTGDVGSPSSTARPNVDNANKTTTNVDEVEKVSENGNQTEESRVSEVANKGDAAIEEAAESGNGMQPNKFGRTQTVGVSESAQEGSSETSQTSSKRYDKERMAENMQGAEAAYNATPTAVQQIMPWLRDDLDPARIEAKKRDANFRKGLHEAVESIRVLSDIASSFAGGNAYRRNAPDYQRYEQEKAKVDDARNKALERFFAAQASDRSYKQQLINAAFGNAFVSEGGSTTNSSQTNAGVQRQVGHNDGYESNVHHNYTHTVGGVGNGNLRNGHSITITNPDNGTATTYTFKNEDNRKKFMDDRYAAISGQQIKITNNAGEKKGNVKAGDNELSQAYVYWLYKTQSGKDARENESMSDEDRFKLFRDIMENKKIGKDAYYGDQEAVSRYIERFDKVQNVTRSLINGGEVKLSSSGGWGDNIKGD